MRKIVLAIFFVAFVSSSYGQVRYWIFFTDKPNATEKLESVPTFLSQKSIDRRAKQGIVVNATDVPVNAAYIQQIKSSGITVLQTSKWLNGISVFATKGQVENIKEFPFVKHVKPVMRLKKQEELSSVAEVVSTSKTYGTYNYGGSANQVTMLRGDFLHDNNSRGQGMLIAQLDGGFTGVESLPAFDSLWARGGIIATYDFVDNDTNVFHGGSHGMSVLSVMAGLAEGQLVGSAPLANYILLKSENEASETTIEEDNWVAAVEFADSVGADIINSSLGYYDFQGGIGNYTWDDLDGRTATTSKAAVMAARKGILVVNSAGNEGGNSWKKIITPADADSILAVGGVNAQREHASFSSTGPTADGRIKPDISAKGAAVFLALPGGNYGPANGTSFSAPLIAGFSACLWQRFPDATAMEIREAIIQSADRYDNPDNQYGHGIPDFFIADYKLSHPQVDLPEPQENVAFFPNPFTDKLTLYMRGENYPVQVKVTAYDAQGNTANSQEVTVYSKFTAIQGFENMAAGGYIFEVLFNGKSVRVKMLR